MTWASRVRPITVGDTVCVAASFMRQVGVYDAETANARGVVKQIIQGFNNAPDRAIVEWAGADLPERVAVGTLSRVTERGIADE